MSEVSMFFEENRLKTFKNWPFKNDTKCTAEKLSEAGFYKCGEEDDDTVKCFLCLKELNGWEPDDDPWNEHIKHTTDCKFAQLRTPQDKLILKEYLNLYHELLKKNLTVAYNKEMQRLDQMSEIREKIVEMFNR